MLKNTNPSLENTPVAETRKTAGWREWVALPELGIGRIKAKLDTGARTSCVHATHCESFTRDGQEWLRFAVQPEQDNEAMQMCEAPLVDRRSVRDSGGHEEIRPVVQTQLKMGDETWPIELTITNRSSMKFRMLIGRTAMAGHLTIRPEDSFLMPLEA